MRSIRAFVHPLLRHFFVPAATAALVLSGVAGGERTASAQEVVAFAPPAPRVEVVTAAPSPNHFWIPGYWGYQPGYGHQWYGGRWEARRPGYAWSQPGWVNGTRGWEFRHGGWAPGGGGFHGGYAPGGGLHGGGYAPGGGGFHGGGSWHGGGAWHGSNGSHGGFHGGGGHGGGGHGGGHR
jgi:hypothetical protein